MPKIDLDICKGCGICVDTCLNNSIKIENNKATINKDTCLGCEGCISSCPNGAITSDRYKIIYPYRWPRSQPQYLLYYQPQFHRVYYPTSRRRRRGWR